MMPGETHSAAPGTAADLSRCQGCASLQQNLNEYVEALITLKQKIINTDNLLTEYQKKCDELQFARRENSTLHHQVEQMLQKISPLQKCQEELGSLKAELEEKKSSLKLYQDTHQEYARVKEECLKTDAQKKKLEAKVKKLEEAAVKQTQDFKQLRNEKKILEKEFKKTQERLDEFSKQKNEKELRHIGTQISNESHGSIDKRKVKLLLKELWLCVNTTHRLPGEGSRCIPEEPAKENSGSRELGEDGVAPPAGGSPLRASSVQTCLAELSMEIEGDFSEYKDVAGEGPGGAASLGDGWLEGGRDPAPGGQRNDEDSMDFSDHDPCFDEDLQAAVDFFKLPPPLLSPVPSPPPVTSPRPGPLPPALAPETCFGECTDSSDSEMHEVQQRNSESVSEGDTPASRDGFSSSGNRKGGGTWEEKPKPQEAAQALSALEVSKVTTVGFGTFTAALTEPSATLSFARETSWTLSSELLSDTEKGILDEARRQRAVRDADRAVPTEKPRPEPLGSLARGEAPALGTSDSRPPHLGPRPPHEPSASEGQTPGSRVMGSLGSELTRGALADGVTSESGGLSLSGHLQGPSRDLEKEREGTPGLISGEPPVQGVVGAAAVAAGLSPEDVLSSSSASAASSLCSHPPSPPGLEDDEDTHMPAEGGPSQLLRSQHKVQATTFNLLAVHAESPQRPIGDSHLESGSLALSPGAGARDSNGQRNSGLGWRTLAKASADGCSLPLAWPRAGESGVSEGPAATMPRGVGTAQLCVLVLALQGWTRRGSGDGSPQLQHELIIPQWKTAESPVREKHPLKAELRVMAEGRELILDLEKNEHLFAPDYTETHYTPSGNPRTTTLKSEDHCFYHGTVRKAEESSVTLSTCRGMRGLITVSSNLSYIIEPLPGSEGHHLIYRSEHLKLPLGNCGFQHPKPTARDWALQFTNQTKKRPRRMKREDLHSMKYVELYLVADYAEFQKNRRDQDATKHKLMEIANYVDKFYRSLNIRIALVGLEVWTHGNMCEVSENPYSTLWSFLSWRRKLLAQKNHDNAQLITGMSFHGTTIGLAPLMAMCSVYQSGGVNMDHSENAVGVAATMAHEMGHNFGMSHDSADCCSASAADGGCIMAAATGHPFPRVFNRCNRRELDRYLQSGGGMCLSNMPDTRTLYGGRRCGNGYLEDGEECDCGEEEECDNPCCNASNCTLREGAECAHGSCCHRCKLLAPGTLCREQARQCDLPEFCTGKSPHCPTNFYQMDGTPCEGGQAYCYNGMCLTYQEQCQQLWGPGARPAPDLCFEKVNVAGDTFGNCGKDLNGEHRKCNMRDAKCGKIQCQSSEARPLESNAVPIDTTIIMNGRQIRCRGTHVYRGPEEEGDMLDPGLVMTGTKCGYNHICFEGQCRNTSFFETEGCGKKCNGHGVCNNNQNCHCFRGWAPPFCNTPGQGGSIDSGPMPPEGAGPVVAGVFSAIFVLAVLVLMYHCCKQKNKLGYLKPLALPSTLRQQFSCPFRVSHNSGTGHANPTFKLQTPQGKRKVTNTPETLRKPSQPPPRPPPDYLHGGSPPVPLPAHLSRAARNSPGAGSPVERKESSRRPPPTRPAPPAPKCVLSQDFSRPRPPQKALPANPVPGRKNLPRPGGPSVLQPTASSPQQTQPLPAPALKFPEYRSQRAMGMTSSKI